jgi:hypothetical protein
MEESKKEPQQPLIDQLKEYAEIRLKLTKYKAVDSGSTIFASLIADVAVGISMLLAFIFACFTLAYYLSDLFESYWKGFGCVALIYFIIAVIVKLNKANIEKPLANAFVKKFFKNKNND